ncbi:unnamed protein product [Orchesella dallaii]|uniref:Uncharacterized protein n=1 Tax=Orchesella dallaii TaxID=48710 RepID=A0ABP1RJ50_9HEXA
MIRAEEQYIAEDLKSIQANAIQLKNIQRGAPGSLVQTLKPQGFTQLTDLVVNAQINGTRNGPQASGSVLFNAAIPPQPQQQSFSGDIRVGLSEHGEGGERGPVRNDNLIFNTNDSVHRIDGNSSEARLTRNDILVNQGTQLVECTAPTATASTNTETMRDRKPTITVKDEAM